MSNNYAWILAFLTPLQYQTQSVPPCALLIAIHDTYLPVAIHGKPATYLKLAANSNYHSIAIIILSY